MISNIFTLLLPKTTKMNLLEKRATLEYSIKQNFGLLGSEEIGRIADLFKYKTHKKGEFLLNKDKSCQHMYFVLSGYVRIFVELETKEVTQWVSGKGYFLTDLASFQFNTPARWNMQTLVDTEIFYIHKSDYDSFKFILSQWNEIEKQFIMHCFITLEERVFSHLAMTAEERYFNFFEQNKELFNQIPLQYIASMLGMTPETFSRIRKKQLC